MNLEIILWSLGIVLIWAAIDKWRAKYRTKKFTKDAMRGFFDIKFNGKRKKDDIDLDDLWDKK